MLGKTPAGKTRVWQPASTHSRIAHGPHRILSLRLEQVVGVDWRLCMGMSVDGDELTVGERCPIRTVDIHQDGLLETQGSQNHVQQPNLAACSRKKLVDGVI